MIKIGTCSWKYDSWRGLVYDELVPKENYLVEYAKQFNTVEIDQWFWSLFSEQDVVLPRLSVVQDYAASVPQGFKFSIKVPNSITLTHFYKSARKSANQPNPYFLSNQLFDDFLKTLQDMHSQIGILMFQFEYLNKQKMESQNIFLNRLSEFFKNLPQNFKYGLEIRNPNYLNLKYFDFLAGLSLSHVFLQGYFMPDIETIFRKFQPNLQSPVVIRLHGPDRGDIEKKSAGLWDKILEPKDDQISEISKIIKELDQKGLEVYVNVNNHYEGSAPRTIEKLKRFLSEIKNPDTDVSGF